MNEKEMLSLAKEKAQNEKVLNDENLDNLTRSEIKEILHNLRVHQIELQMQNEELKRYQEELDETKARYFDLYDLAPEGYLIISEKGIILEANLTAAKLFRYERTELTEQRFSKYILNEDEDIYYLHRKKLFESLIPQEFELRMVKKDGTVFYVNIHASANTKDEIRTCKLMLSDISDRKCAEKELFQSEERYKLLFEHSGVAIGYYTSNGIVISFNKKAAENMGGVEKDYIGKSVYELFSREDADLYYKRIKLALSSNEIHEYEDKIVFPTGTKWFSSIYSRVFMQNDIITGVQIASVDITQRKKSESDSKNKSTFLANMSHEIRTPINGIIGLNELLFGTELTEKQKDYTAKIGISAKILFQIVNDILDFSKIESGKLYIEKTEFTIDSIITQIKDNVYILALNKGLDLIFDIDSKSIILLLGDPLRIKQVLLNLTINAIKFTSKGSVHISTAVISEDDSTMTIRFSIKDTGIGITREQLNKLFTSFTQADESTTRKYGGTGLGLAISKSLVEMMGGKIEVKSIYGEGSEFCFTIKFSKCIDEENEYTSNSIKELQKIPSRSRPSNEAAKTGSLKILLVEDNEINQMVAREMLEVKGFIVDVADNGKIAVDKLFGNMDYDVILMDLQMPVMDGYEATRIIRSNAKFTTIPIIAITADAIKGIEEDAISSGMNYYITKPIDSEVLYNKIIELIQKTKK